MATAVFVAMQAYAVWYFVKVYPTTQIPPRGEGADSQATFWLFFVGPVSLIVAIDIGWILRLFDLVPRAPLPFSLLATALIGGSFALAGGYLKPRPR